MQRNRHAFSITPTVTQLSYTSYRISDVTGLNTTITLEGRVVAGNMRGRDGVRVGLPSYHPTYLTTAINAKVDGRALTA